MWPRHLTSTIGSTSLPASQLICFNIGLIKLMARRLNKSQPRRKKKRKVDKRRKRRRMKRNRKRRLRLSQLTMMMMTPSLNLHQRLLQLLQSRNLMQRRRKINPLRSQLSFSRWRSMTKRLILTLLGKKFLKEKSTVSFGTTNQRRSMLPTECKSSRWVVLLKTIKCWPMTFLSLLKNGKKSNLLTWLACKNFELDVNILKIIYKRNIK